MGGRVSKPKIVTLDIETAPLKVYAWGLWDQQTGVNQIDTEWSILSFSWKWLHEKKAHYMDCRGEPREDGLILDALWLVLDDADIVVSQNGIAFDIKKINARLVMKGYRPYSPIRQIDTKVIAKKHFEFTSNRLEWMGKNVAGQKKSEHKKFPGFELWDECLKDNWAAWDEMKKYNVRDVLATEKLYLKLRPWMEGHPNVATYGNEPHACPKCGATHLHRRGFAVTQTGRYVRYACGTCGGWSRSRVVEPAPRRRELLSN